MIYWVWRHFLWRYVARCMACGKWSRTADQTADGVCFRCVPVAADYVPCERCGTYQAETMYWSTTVEVWVPACRPCASFYASLEAA